MLTRRRVLCSIPAFSVITTSDAKSDSQLQEQVSKILQLLSKADDAAWTAHIEADFILIKREL